WSLRSTSPGVGPRPSAADLDAPVADPGAALDEQAGLEAEVEQAGLAAEPVVGMQLQLAGLPGWGELVLGDLHPHAAANNSLLLGDALRQEQLQADRGVVAERPPTGGVEGLAGDSGALAELVGGHHR